MVGARLIRIQEMHHGWMGLGQGKGTMMTSGRKLMQLVSCEENVFMPCTCLLFENRRIRFFNKDPVLTLSDLCNNFEGRLNPLQKRWGNLRFLSFCWTCHDDEPDSLWKFR